MTRDASAFQQMTDAGLLEAAAGGSHAAFSELVSRYFQPVYRLVWRMTGGAADAEDIAQEAFVKLWKNPAQVREAGALKGWLMRVASNGVIDRSRKPRSGTLEDAPEIADPQARPDAPLDRAQAASLVDRRIAGLPERQRQALSLVYFEGLTNIEAAAAMEVSVDALESLLSRARRSLKESLSTAWRELLGGLAETGR
ncbi:sigma-70 family RNA polymerase sigma factor [Aestuariivirga sp.]|uniref:sigma-70 family RNA polymerase sigma factor n=1 Tax=Aestuariivirga sp. TaxID=2650926 RepID=UPI003BAAB135